MVSLKIDPSTIKFNIDGNSTGNIYFSINGKKSFPDDEWNDFVDIILNWWINAIIEMIESNLVGCELLFMDGPFSLIITKDIQGENWIIKTQKSNSTLNEVEIVGKDFVDMIYKKARQLMHYYYLNNFKNEDIEILEKSLNSFKEVKNMDY